MRALVTASIICAACACAVRAQTVVVNDNILLQTSPTSSRISIDISKYPDLRPGSIFGYDTEINMTYTGQSLIVNDLSADYGSDWFLTQPGDVFSAATIEAGLFPVLINVGPGPGGVGELSVGPNDFYFGVRTNSAFANDRPNRTSYGWVHLRPVDGTLTMVGNVMSYNSGGIIVGTTTVVPEPATWLLAVFPLHFVRRTRR